MASICYFGGSRNYSNNNFDGDRFYVNSRWTWVSHDKVCGRRHVQLNMWGVATIWMLFLQWTNVQALPTSIVFGGNQESIINMPNNISHWCESTMPLGCFSALVVIREAEWRKAWTLLTETWSWVFRLLGQRYTFQIYSDPKPTLEYLKDSNITGETMAVLAIKSENPGIQKMFPYTPEDHQTCLN